MLNLPLNNMSSLFHSVVHCFTFVFHFTFILRVFKPERYN